MIDHTSFADETAMLQPGDRLYFYTDGVIEALDRSEGEFGYERLLAALQRQRDRPLRVALDFVAGAVRDWSGGLLRDDVSLLRWSGMDEGGGIVEPWTACSTGTRCSPAAAKTR